MWNEKKGRKKKKRKLSKKNLVRHLNFQLTIKKLLKIQPVRKMRKNKKNNKIKLKEEKLFKCSFFAIEFIAASIRYWYYSKD